LVMRHRFHGARTTRTPLGNIESWICGDDIDFKMTVNSFDEKKTSATFSVSEEAEQKMLVVHTPIRTSKSDMPSVEWKSREDLDLSHPSPDRMM